MAKRKKKETPMLLYVAGSTLHERYVRNWKKGLKPKTKNEAQFRKEIFKPVRFWKA